MPDDKIIFDFPMTALQITRLWRLQKILMRGRDESDDELFRLLDAMMISHPEWLDQYVA